MIKERMQAKKELETGARGDFEGDRLVESVNGEGEVVVDDEDTEG